jgi:ABC-type phosphate transport system substrate-binding protein
MKFLQKLLIMGITLASFSSLAEVSVIVNSGNSDAVDAKLIKRIYLGKAKSFPAGEKITVLTLNDDAPETEYFRQKALKKSNSQFKSHWSKLAFTGKGTPPKKISSPAEMINEVKSNTSAIGFVDSSAVTGDVKVVATF